MAANDVQEFADRECHCERRAWLRTSWTPANPGRRYVMCPIGKCTFWDWVDPPMCYRAVAIIPGLLRRINACEAEIKKLKWSKKKLQLLVFVLAGLCVFLMGKVMAEL